MNTLTLVTPPDHALSSDLINTLQRQTGSQPPHWLEPGRACDLAGIETPDAIRPETAALLADQPVDWCLQPETNRRKRLLICDMDSTIIQQECIDEIATAAGIGEAIAAITERAMRGELDFTASLNERVAQLAGLEEAMLLQVWQEHIRLTPGAEALIRTMNAHDAHTLLVSGGFTFFSSRVAEAVGFRAHHANILEIEQGRLTGQVLPPVLDRDAKRRLLESGISELGLSRDQTMAVGDGANDAGMVEAAGLGIAYHAKPGLQAVAGAQVNHGDLTTLLYFQGYSEL